MNTNINEAVSPRNASDFTKTQQVRMNSKSDKSEIEQIAFYKMIMTLSNYHSTVSDMYSVKEDAKLAKYHLDLSVRFRNEANRIKSQ